LSARLDGERHRQERRKAPTATRKVDVASARGEAIGYSPGGGDRGPHHHAVKRINRGVDDATRKPPGTIEGE
jgi:hypothetical protein